MHDYKKMLVPVDYSAPSREAATRALDLARKFESQILFLHVIDSRYTTMVPAYLVEPAPLMDQHLRETAQKKLEELLGGLDTSGVDVETKIEFGVPGDTVLEEAQAWGADIVVMGSHGRTGLRRAVLGSQAEMVVRRAEMPVLVVHAKVDETGETRNQRWHLAGLTAYRGFPRASCRVF